MDPIPIPIQISTHSSLPHHLLDARHRARDVLEERILAQKPNDARLLERLARAALKVRDVQPNAAILQTRNPADQSANAVCAATNHRSTSAYVLTQADQQAGMEATYLVSLHQFVEDLHRTVIGRPRSQIKRVIGQYCDSS